MINSFHIAAFIVRYNELNGTTKDFKESTEEQDIIPIMKVKRSRERGPPENKSVEPVEPVEPRENKESKDYETYVEEIEETTKGIIQSI